MTSKLTRERIELIANFHRAMTLPPSHAEIEELARMALAAMDSEPVAYISKSGFDAGYPHILARRDFNKACTMAVYAAQPAPVVSSEPVAWVWQHLDQFNVTIYYERARDLALGGVNVEPLYRHAQPVQVCVPTFEEWCERTEQKPVGWVRDAMKEAYDACRAAMLNGGKP